ncbi:hypothetical protein [Thermophilibacter provencensis]|uniref:Uncharacterized protein n=1 Tax=Thermophilibacter provencensis TaxID=1852386 RepID=A0ABT7V1U1_9ACTN|nr:hypothetical protein [Thermophilibacter provencensis]MDM8270559.1 hypothetical protein [Thermophilibacter provencensis]
MPTDTERREVAQNMRDGVKSKTECELLSLNGSSAAIRWLISYAVFGDKKYHSGVDLLDRLADLIEPPTQCPYYHSDRHYCSVHDDVVDRDALLALAEEMDDLAEAWGGKYPTNRVAAYARSIREACNVVDAG